MEANQIMFHTKNIENGKNVISTVKMLNEEISILRWHAIQKETPKETRKVLFWEADLIECQLFFSLEKFIRGSFLEQ